MSKIQLLTKISLRRSSILIMGKKSPYWKDFAQIDKSQAVCHLCDKKIQYSGNTSNLRSHLAVSHASVLSDIEANKDAIKKKKSVDNARKKFTESPERKSSFQSAKFAPPEEKPSTLCQVDSSTSDNIKSKQKKHENIKQCFGNVSDYKQGGDKHKKLTDKLLYMICKDCEPFNIVMHFEACVRSGASLSTK